MDVLFGVAILFFATYKVLMSNLDNAPLMGDRETALDAILKGIIGPLDAPLKMGYVLLAQAILETGNFKAHYFHTTNSLFNRHKGSGRGEWTGKTFYVSAGDADLRIYDDVYQSARDMLQLLRSTYPDAVHALQSGDAGAYYDALQVVGFSTDLGYAQNLKRTYAEIA